MLCRRFKRGLPRNSGKLRESLHRRFQSELAVTLRGWVLWQRLRRALMHHLRGHTLTDSAHAAGFADLAHLSRSLRRMFGIGAAQLQGLQLHAA